ncbi:MAG: ribonuclease R [Eubacteriales bacterium]|nr:ribonuclease R [Eubacteriales bacterium]
MQYTRRIEERLKKEIMAKEKKKKERMEKKSAGGKNKTKKENFNRENQKNTGKSAGRKGGRKSGKNAAQGAGERAARTEKPEAPEQGKQEEQSADSESPRTAKQTDDSGALEIPEPSVKSKRRKKKTPLLTGIYTSNARGFGFVSVEGLEQDLFIPSGKSGGAFYGDTVEVEAEPLRGQNGHAASSRSGKDGRAAASGSGEKRGRGSAAAAGYHREAAVVRIVERGITSLVGTYQRSRGYGFVVPDNAKIGRDVHVRQADSMHAVDGHKVVVKITDYGSGEKHPTGVVTEILGHINDPGVDILSIIRAYDLPEEFPEEVRAQVAAMNTESVPENMADQKGARAGAMNAESVPEDAADRNGAQADTAAGVAQNLREDLRDMLMVTIDGEDAKDLDDAVSLTKRGRMWELGVHIADVSQYVTEGTPLDREALNRATSVYLVDRVIPMLPHELSNGICSLNQGEDRYALSCLMTVNAAGEVTDHRIVESLIRADARLSYNGVRRVLEEGDTSEIEEALRRQGMRGTKTKTERIARMLRNMARLAVVLRKRRTERGSIDFDFPESKIILDEKGRPVDIYPYEHNEATNLIEDFMLLANETVAAHCYWLELPFVYRTHGAPDEEKIQQLASFVKNYGLRLKNAHGEVHPREIQQLLAGIKGTPQEDMLSRMTLRSMQQARYTTECDGHFGLAMQYYCHFTSPIRRYPDLQIHRIIKEYLHGRMTREEADRLRSILPNVARVSSERERRAADAERETQKQKKCEYMALHLGEEYEGKVSGVTGWGLYVELPNTVEGLIHISNLKDDYYAFHEEEYVLAGERTGKRYALGDPIRVSVAAADTVARTIDFLPVEEENAAPEQENGKHRTKRSGAGRRSLREQYEQEEELPEIAVTAQGEDAFVPEKKKPANSAGTQKTKKARRTKRVRQANPQRAEDAQQAANAQKAGNPQRQTADAQQTSDAQQTADVQKTQSGKRRRRRKTKR